MQLGQASLTQICKMKAAQSLLTLLQEACCQADGEVQEAEHMEWVDDVQMFMRKGAASPVAYRMAAPLLADIATSLKVRQINQASSWHYDVPLIFLACHWGNHR